MDRRTRRTTPYLLRFGLPASALMLLSACSSMSAPTSADLALACPRISIVRDLKTATQFRPGAGRDLSDIAVRGEILDYSGNCEYAKDGVTVNLNLLLGAEKGPAMTGNQAAFRYFVAVNRPGEETPAAKSSFDTTVGFPEGQARGTSKEETVQRIPLPADTNAKDWNIYIGFQLNAEQLDYNLSQMAKARATQR
jgi:hypothetical protein